MEEEVTVMLETAYSPEWGTGWRWRVLRGSELKGEGMEPTFQDACHQAGMVAGGLTQARINT